MIPLTLNTSQDSQLLDFPDQAASLTRRLTWLFLARSFTEVSHILVTAPILVLPGVRGLPTTPKTLKSINVLLASLRSKLPQNLIVVSESYEPASLSPTSCAVSARCKVNGYEHGEQPNPEDPTAEFICSLVWTSQNGEEPVLGLFHCSIQSWELVPTGTRGSTEATVTRELRATGSARLQIRDAEGTTHWLAPESIVAVKAAHQYTDVLGTDRRLRIHAPFGSIVSQLSGAVVQVHRSYAVNPRHISRTESNKLILTTGLSVPIPKRSTSKVQAMLQEHLDTKS